MYKEKEKVLVRKEILSHAVKILTKGRINATLTNPRYIELIRDTLTKSDYGFDFLAKYVRDKSLEKWNEFYYSIVKKKKKPSELRVAYLSGPNPENDLEILVNLGVLPENVWAFESDNELYNQALKSTLNSEFPHIKIQECKISDFFNTTPLKFDIVYLDFCGPLPNRNKKQKNLSTITSLLFNHVLNSPGILITNFSLPSETQDRIGRELIAKLVAIYLFRKTFLESPDPLEPDIKYYNKYTKNENLIPYAIYEGHIGLTFLEWKDRVLQHLEEYYSQFITRLLIDLSSMIIPYYTFSTNKSYMNQLFKIFTKEQRNKFILKFYHYNEKNNNQNYFNENGFNQEKFFSDLTLKLDSTTPIDRLNGTVHHNTMFPITWSLATLNKQRNYNDSNFPNCIYNDQDFLKFTESFLNQIAPTNNIEDLLSNFELVYFLASGEFIDKNCDLSSKKLCELSKINWMFRIPQLCDLFLFHQIKEFLIRQLSVPYHLNLTKTRRWSYKAKKTRMFTDLLVLDECRYLYDWMPNIGTIKESLLNDLERQLIFRFILDGVMRHNRWIVMELFYGTAAICKFQYKGLEFENLRLRKYIN